MYRDPITNRFTPGQPPAQTDEGFSVTNAPAQPNEQASQGRGGNYLGGWDYIPRPGFDPGCSANKDDEVHDIRDVLGTKTYAVKDSHNQTGNIGPEPESSDDGPIGQGGSDMPRRQ